MVVASKKPIWLRDEYMRDNKEIYLGKQVRSRYIQHKNGNWMLTVEYSSKDKQFFIKLPDHYIPIIKKEMVRGRVGGNQDEVEELWKKAEQEYGFRADSKKKVILYSFLANVEASIDGEDFSITTMTHHGGKKINHHELSLYWVVCYQTDVPEHFYARERKKFYNLDGSTLDIPYDVRDQKDTMDYTEARELFFKTFGEELGMLVFNVERFLSQKEALLEIIDTGNRLPFFKTEEKE